MALTAVHGKSNKLLADCVRHGVYLAAGDACLLCHVAVACMRLLARSSWDVPICWRCVTGTTKKPATQTVVNGVLLA